MGTRHITAVILDGQPKIAQYGQWDGYPSSAGIIILRFLRGIDNKHVPGMREKFLAAVSRCQFAPEKIEKLWDDAGYRDRYLTRDLGAEILDSVFNSDLTEIVLRNEYDFVRDGLFCEYAYVIDLDKNTFEIYEGFKKEDVPEGERFHGLPRALDHNGKDHEYAPVHHMKTYSLDALPSEDEFLVDLKQVDEEEEEDAA